MPCEIAVAVYNIGDADAAAAFATVWSSLSVVDVLYVSCMYYYNIMSYVILNCVIFPMPFVERLRVRTAHISTIYFYVAINPGIST